MLKLLITSQHCGSKRQATQNRETSTTCNGIAILATRHTQPRLFFRPSSSPSLSPPSSSGIGSPPFLPPPSPRRRCDSCLSSNRSPSVSTINRAADCRGDLRGSDSKFVTSSRSTSVTFSAAVPAPSTSDESWDALSPPDLRLRIPLEFISTVVEVLSVSNICCCWSWSSWLKRFLFFRLLFVLIRNQKHTYSD